MSPGNNGKPFVPPHSHDHVANSPPPCPTQNHFEKFIIKHLSASQAPQSPPSTLHAQPAKKLCRNQTNKRRLKMTTLATISSQSTSWRESVCGAHLRRTSFKSQPLVATSPILIASSLDSVTSYDVSISPESFTLPNALDSLHLRRPSLGSRASRKVNPIKSIPNHRDDIKLDKHLPGHRRVNVNDLPRPLSRASSMPVFGNESDGHSEEEDVVAMAISSLEKYRTFEPSHPESYTAVNSARESATQQGTFAMVSPVLGKRMLNSQTLTMVETHHQDPDVFRLDVYSTYLSNPRALLKSPPRIMKRKEGFSFTEADLALEMAEDESRGQLKALFRQLAVEKKLDQAVAASERAVEGVKSFGRKKSIVESMLSGEAFMVRLWNLFETNTLAIESFVGSSAGQLDTPIGCD
jgi:hypothetical protein